MKTTATHLNDHQRQWLTKIIQHNLSGRWVTTNERERIISILHAGKYNCKERDLLRGITKYYKNHWTQLKD